MTTETEDDTIKVGVQITHDSMFNVMTAVNQMGFGWDLTATKVTPHTVDFMMSVDSGDTPHVIRLNADGTWIATSEVSV